MQADGQTDKHTHTLVAITSHPTGSEEIRFVQNKNYYSVVGWKCDMWRYVVQ